MRGAFHLILVLSLILPPPVHAESKSTKIASKDNRVKSRTGNRVFDPNRKIREVLFKWIDTTTWDSVLNGKGDEETDDSAEEAEVDLNDLGNGNGFGSGKGSPVGGPGSGGGKGGAGFSMNENAKGGNPVDPGPKQGDGDNKPPPNGENPPPGLRGVPLSRWYAMCLFVDPRTSGDVNGAVKKLVDDAGKCGIYLHVIPKTVVANFDPNSDTEINSLQQNACNILEGLQIPAASTSTCSSGMDVAAKMCDDKTIRPDGSIEWNQDVAGCAQMQKAGGGKIDPKHLNYGGGSMSQASGGAPAPSIERQGACDGDTIGHEAQGHSQMGVPNGSTHGKGIGDPDDPSNQPNGGAEGSGGGGWTQRGCTDMVANSFPNTKNYMWYPDKQTYFRMEQDPVKQFNLRTDKVFGKPRDPDSPPGGTVPPTITQNIPQDPMQKPQGMRPEPPGSMSRNQPPPAGDPHKKPMGGARGGDASIEQKWAQIEQELATGLEGFTRNNSPDMPPPMVSGTPPPLGEPGSSTSVIYDENAGRGGSSVALGEGSGSTTKYDENAKGGNSVGLDGKPTGSGSGSGDNFFEFGGDRDIASSTEKKDDDEKSDDGFFKKKKKKGGKKSAGWKRERGTALRQPGSAIRGGGNSIGNLYQSGSVSFEGDND